VKHGLFYKDREFTSNNPVNLEMADTRFVNQDQWLFRFGVLWLPSATWRRFNQSRRISNNEGPRIQFQSYFAMGTSSYSKLSLQVNHTIPLQRLGRLQVQLHGVHYMLRPTQFIDYTFLDRYENVYFIGLEKEFKRMAIHSDKIKHLPVKDAYEMAQYIAGCKLFIGGQSMAFAIAEQLKVKRVLEQYILAPNVIPQGGEWYTFHTNDQFKRILVSILK
jgi:hypothetical protein